MAIPLKNFGTIVFAIFLLVCTGAYGDTESSERHKALSRELVGLVLNYGAYDSMMEQAADTAMVVMRANLQVKLGRELSYREDAKLRIAFSRAMATVYPQSAWEQVIVPLYMKYFDAAETKKLLEFYKTPLGLKALTLMPRLQQEGAQAGRALVSTKEDEFLLRFEDEIRREFPR